VRPVAPAPDLIHRLQLQNALKQTSAAAGALCGVVVVVVAIQTWVMTATGARRRPDGEPDITSVA
jgi:hypothetical protein